MSIEEATESLREAGIARSGEPQEIAESMAFIVSPATHWMDGLDVETRRRKTEVDLSSWIRRHSHW
jgi:NAD(P)-dependent dehydrogenase (short-subunit alcohol dehydrogenase family)